MKEEQFDDQFMMSVGYEIETNYIFQETENLVHYDEEYENPEDVVDVPADEVFDLLDIEPVTAAQRLAMFPEMQQLHPMKRRSREGLSLEEEDNEIRLKVDAAGEKKLKFRSMCDKSEALMCMDCGFCYKSEILMTKHLKFHEHGIPIPTPGYLCPYADCDIRCDCQATVNEHVRIQHDRPDIINETYVFNKWSEFETWKSNLELTTSSRFSFSSGRTNMMGNVKRFSCYYAAVPSRPHIQRAMQRLRRPKKNERACTAHFTVKETYSQVVVRACLAHCGHDSTTARDLPLTNEIRKEIATALMQGAKDQDIVDSMRDASTPEDRRYYIQPYEVRNVYNKLRQKVNNQVINEICRQTCEDQKKTGTSSIHEGDEVEEDVGTSDS